MKLTFNRSLAMDRSRFVQVAFLFLWTLSLTGVGLQADTDISSSQNGAFVLFSSPLSKGVLPETLLNGKPHQNPFAPQKGSQVLVIQLDNSYRLSNIRNLPVDARVYLLNKKPTGKETWLSLIASGATPAVNGAVGQYLVIVYDKDPLVFSDPLLDGDPLSANTGSTLGSGFGLGNSTPLAITPLTSTEIISH